jgi:hypothetical protein
MKSIKEAEGVWALGDEQVALLVVTTWLYHKKLAYKSSTLFSLVWKIGPYVRELTDRHV